MSLIPIMNLFVALIPFLMISAAFVRLGQIDVTLPGESSKAETSNGKDLSLSLGFKLENDKLTVEEFRSGFAEPVAAVKREFSVDHLEGVAPYLRELRSRYGEVTTSLFYATPETPYLKAVKVLNAVKTSGVPIQVAVTTAQVALVEAVKPAGESAPPSSGVVPREGARP